MHQIIESICSWKKIFKSGKISRKLRVLPIEMKSMLFALQINYTIVVSYLACYNIFYVFILKGFQVKGLLGQDM